MSHSDSYYDAAARQEDFADSVILRPIQLKPTVVPSILGRSNPQNTILAAYDKIKLTEHIESTQDGKVIELISLQSKSRLTVLNPIGIEFLQRFSGIDIAFVLVTGQKCAGKSFFIDKLLNLSNVQGNNFSISSNKPAICIWSTPFVKQQMRFFIGQVSGCAPGSKQFDMLLPYLTILSSVVINLQDFKEKNTATSYEKLDQKLNNFLEQFKSDNFTQEQNRSQVVKSIFPKVIYKLNRKEDSGSYFFSKSQFRTQQIYLPNARNPEYRGIDEDLIIHSFLNKKCVNEQYISQVSVIFGKILIEIHEKKHRQLVFNGGIILKYLGQLSLVFHKGKNIDIGKVYYDIVKDLYISAYNYCVICYHQLLEEALADEKPRSLEELIQIFEKTSSQIFQKYNQFSLQQSIHLQYQQKLEKHIQSKEKLILQINKKKTQIELKKIYDQTIELNNVNKVWSQINSINSKFPTYTHGKDSVMGKKLSEVIMKLNTGNNVDYILKKNIEKLAQQIKYKRQELLSIQQYNKKVKSQTDEKNKANQKQRAQLILQNDQKDKIIQQLKQQIRIYQNVEISDPIKSKTEEKNLLQKVQKNQKILEQLRSEANEPIQSNKNIKEIENRIQQVQSKYLSQELTLKAIQESLQAGNENPQAPQAQQTQMKLKKQGPSEGGMKESEVKKQKKEGQSNIKNSKKSSK